MGGVGRYWWLVLIMTALAVSASVYATTVSPTTYTGRASLIVSSENRSPDQDAVLVQGYIDYFNDTAFQAQLLDDAGLEDPVTLEARAAAASPIMLVEATADSPDYAQQAASAVAASFQDAINAVGQESSAAEIEDLQEQIAEATAAGGDDAATTVAALEEEIATLEEDRTNQLQELQFEGGVATNAPSLRNNVVLGAVGGFVLGLLAASALVARRRRIRSQA